MASRILNRNSEDSTGTKRITRPPKDKYCRLSEDNTVTQKDNMAIREKHRQSQNNIGNQRTCQRVT
jgi:hypothetical protein